MFYSSSCLSISLVSLDTDSCCCLSPSLSLSLSVCMHMWLVLKAIHKTTLRFNLLLDATRSLKLSRRITNHISLELQMTWNSTCVYPSLCLLTPVVSRNTQVRSPDTNIYWEITYWSLIQIVCLYVVFPSLFSLNLSTLVPTITNQLVPAAKVSASHRMGKWSWIVYIVWEKQTFINCFLDIAGCVKISCSAS